LAVRALDCVLIEGPKIYFRVGFAILQLLRSTDPWFCMLA